MFLQSNRNRSCQIWEMCTVVWIKLHPNSTLSFIKHIRKTMKWYAPLAELLRVSKPVWKVRIITIFFPERNISIRHTPHHFLMATIPFPECLMFMRMHYGHSVHHHSRNLLKLVKCAVPRMLFLYFFNVVIISIFRSSSRHHREFQYKKIS